MSRRLRRLILIPILVTAVLLSKKETASRQAVLQGNGTYRERTVFVDNFRGFCIDRMERYLKAEMLTKEINLCFQHGAQCGRCIHL